MRQIIDLGIVLIFPVLIICNFGLDAKADNTRDCRSGKTPQIRINACTKLIDTISKPSMELAQLYRNRASAYAEIRKEQNAVVDFTAAISLRPDFAAAFVGRAHVRLAQKDYDGALQDYSTAIEIKPRSTSAFLTRGYIQLIKSNFNAAIADFSAAITIDPENTRAYNNRGLVYRKLKKYDLAMEDYNKAIRINPIYALAYANRGYVQEAIGNKKNAIEDFSTALLINPSLTGAKAALKRLGKDKALVSMSDARIRRGKSLVELNCASCHAVAQEKKSQNPKAPPFRTIHKRHPILDLEQPLKRSIAYPHDEMPNFLLSNSQIDEIVAYINSLKVN